MKPTAQISILSTKFIADIYILFINSHIQAKFNYRNATSSKDKAHH